MSVRWLQCLVHAAQWGRGSLGGYIVRCSQFRAAESDRGRKRDLSEEEVSQHGVAEIHAVDYGHV